MYFVGGSQCIGRCNGAPSTQTTIDCSPSHRYIGRYIDRYLERYIVTQTTIDCSPGRARWGSLFARGENEKVSVEGLTLRKCLIESQMARALSPHPDHGIDVSRPTRWPSTRGWASFEGNVWTST